MSWKQMLEENQDGNKPLTWWQTIECTIVVLFILAVSVFLGIAAYLRLKGG